MFGILGPFLHSIEISKLSKCSTEIADDSLNFGIACTKKLLDIHEFVVEYPTDISRLKQDALASMHTTDEAARANADVLVITNATLLTMETGSLQYDVLHGAVLFTRNGRIEAIGGAQDIVVPEGAMLIDVEGGRHIHLHCSHIRYSLRARIYHARFHRRTRPLERFRRLLSCAVLGAANVPRIWCNYTSQVRTFCHCLHLCPL